MLARCLAMMAWREFGEHRSQPPERIRACRREDREIAATSTKQERYRKIAFIGHPNWKNHSSPYWRKAVDRTMFSKMRLSSKLRRPCSDRTTQDP
jgi:hypothetical protein